jgi:hypothetical protein
LGASQIPEVGSLQSVEQRPNHVHCRLLCAYRAFSTTFEAFKAPFFQREKVLQFPGRGRTVDKPNLVLEEFVAEENVSY